MSDPSTIPKCAICSNVLSYFPISESVNNEPICGRCPLPKDQNFVRVSCYETMVENYNFPCRFVDEGCKSKLPPRKVPLHESRCPHRMIPCPARTFCDCPWEGNAQNLLTHCQEEHGNHFLKRNVLEVDILNSREYHVLVKSSTELIVCRYRFDHPQNVFWCSVVMCGDGVNITNFKCNVVMENEVRKLKVQVRVTKESEPSCDTKIDLSSLRTGCNSNISFSIDIIDQTQTRKKLISVDRILSTLKCSICNDTLNVPIFLCSSGHSVCQNCDKTNRNCSVCKGGFDHIQNFGLRGVTNLPIYRCTNSGCGYVSTFEGLERHRHRCLLSAVDDLCPLTLPHSGCTWSGPRKSLIDHLERHHPMAFFKCAALQVEGKSCQLDVRHAFVLKRFDGLFKVCLQIGEMFANCSVDFIASGLEEGFCFSIEIKRDDCLIFKSSRLCLGSSQLIPLNFKCSEENTVFNIYVSERSV